MSARDWANRVSRSLPLGVHTAVPPSVRRALRHRAGRFYMWESEFDYREGPVLQPGEVSGPPDFIGIGVQSAGTSRWHVLISQHPAVFVRPDIHKEHHFFTRFGIETFGPQEIAAYHRWFPRPSGTITGEWTPAYFHCPWAPELAAQAAPGAKILLLLRDPVERFRSGLARPRAGGRMGGDQVNAFHKSFYASSLVRWREHFSPDQILVLQYEACSADPSTQLARTYEFLGVDSTFQPGNLHASINPTRTVKPELPVDARARLVGEVRSDVDALAELVPTLDLSLWPACRD